VFAGYGMGRVGRGSVRDRGPLTMADTLVWVNAGAWPDRKRDHVSANAENEDVTRTTSPPPERLTGTPFSLPCTISARLRYFVRVTFHPKGLCVHLLASFSLG